MVGKLSVKCAKCGVTSKEDPSLTFHRFPVISVHGSLKAKVWAKFCYPACSLTDDSLKKLHTQHKMLCSKHFDDSSYTSSDKKRLNKFAIPTEARTILAEFLDVQNYAPQQSQEIHAISNRDIEQASTSSLTTESHTPQYPQELTESSHIHQFPEPKIQAKAISNRDMEQASTSSLTTESHTPQYPQELTESSHIHQFPEPKIQAKELQRRTGFLKEIDIKTVQELSPRKLKLYKTCRKNLSEIIRLRKKFKEIKMNKKSLLSALTQEDSVNNLLQSNISGPFCLLLQSQLKNVPRKITGRRWSLDDKILALSIYKKSSACYRLLRRLFCLPSPTSLKMLLNKIPLLCGINKHVIYTIKEITSKRNVNENICILAFDEMAIRKNLYYNNKIDQIEGYQDHASQGRTPQVANHALTFMAIGVRKRWKQPIAFYFSADCVTADRLAVLIKEVLKACFSAGLEVIGTVSDLDGVNIRAINSLGSTRDHPFFYFEGHEIVTMLDPPHLLKCFRNNFLKHEIEFTSQTIINGKQVQGVGKWCHIEEFYEIDNINQNFVFAPALTKQHLQPNGKQKMKVRLAAQVLSHSVAAGIYARVSRNELPQEAVWTAEILTNMDQLFDAVNGDTPDLKRGKPLLTNMSATSRHLDFFHKMKFFFTEMKFLGARSKPPSQDGWIRTINAIERIFKNLNNKNVKYMSVRRLNQDPLENCFGCIRSNCGCNPNPTSVQFVAALKTGMLMNLINNNTKNRNCLDDDNSLLSNFKVFLNKGSEQTTFIKEQSDELSLTDIECDIPQCSGEMEASAYVCGFIAKNLSINCEKCKQIMFTDQNIEVCHLFTVFKEYDDLKRQLKYVQPSFCTMVDSAATIINNYLKQSSHEYNIKKKLINICENLNKEWLQGCGEHSAINFQKIINATISITLKRFCTLKNRGFVEEASKKNFLRKINILKHV